MEGYRAEDFLKVEESAEDMRAPIVNLVRGAFSHMDEWAAIDDDAMHVQNKTKGGLGKTYIISAEGCIPVVLHWRPTTFEEAPAAPEYGHPSVMRRLIAGHAALEHAQVGPERLALGGNWFIESWGGAPVPFGEEIEEMPAAYGKIFASLHAVPTDWFEPWRAQVEEFNICPLFWFKAVYVHTGEPTMEAWKSRCLQNLQEITFEPLSAAGKKIVTSHGDCNRANMVQTGSGLKLIDLEDVHINYAVRDFADVFLYCGHGDDANHAWKLSSTHKHRAFLKAYLEEQGEPSDAQTVDLLLADSILAAELLESSKIGIDSSVYESRSKTELLKAALAKLTLLTHTERASLTSREALWSCEPFAELEVGLREADASS